MSISEPFATLVGDWSGTNRLNLSWMPAPIFESPSTAVVRPRVGGQFVEIAYTWSYEGKPQEGLLLFGIQKDGSATAFWTDSWHSANVLMACKGEVTDVGALVLFGSYSVPDHPDWGWRTDVIPKGDGFRYVMYNVSPDGDEELAVETDFVRKNQTDLN